jgi:ParB-like chromosome segregation protein Spo0J
MQNHRYANIFPMMNDEEFNQLVDSIRNHGLHHPIVTFEGKILDGRNRYSACQKAGVKPHYIEYKGDDSIGYVERSNLHRRHLNYDQQASVVAKLAVRY